jgi:hypothetical protein
MMRSPCSRAAGNAANFRTYATWATRLAARTAGPSYAAPPQVAAHGFTIQSSNLLHFLDHTWEFCRLGARANKPMTTFWPQGTSPSQFVAYWTPADAAGPWAWAAHGVGTLIAGGVGYWLGSKVTRHIYELVVE